MFQFPTSTPAATQSNTLFGAANASNPSSQLGTASTTGPTSSAFNFPATPGGTNIFGAPMSTTTGPAKSTGFSFMPSTPAASLTFGLTNPTFGSNAFGQQGQAGLTNLSTSVRPTQQQPQPQVQLQPQLQAVTSMPSSKTLQKHPLYILENLQLSYDLKSPLCKFKHVFYNVVDGTDVHRYSKPELMDDSLWSQALADNPDPKRMVPVLAVGFDDLNARIVSQNKQTDLYRSKTAELHHRVDALFRRQQVETQQRLLSIKKKYDHLARVILGAMKMLEGRRRSPSVPLLPQEGELKLQIDSLVKKVSLDQLLIAKLSQTAECLQSYQHKSLAGPSWLDADPSELDAESLKSRTLFLEMLNDQQKALNILVNSCSNSHECVKEIQHRMKMILK